MRLVITFLISAICVASLAFLAINVTRELQLLNSADSDNVQWTLSQTEVEFLEFEMRLDLASRADAPDLATLRREFDIFYSRIKTLREGSIYEPVRVLPEFSANLAAMQTFLDNTVPAIDSSDPVLKEALPELSLLARDLRAGVRRLSNSGLEYFARESDMRREKVSITLIQMATGVSLLVLLLLLLSLYLGYLNRQNVRRRRQAIQTSKRMNVVTSTALDAVVVCDVNGRILEFNEAAVQIFGYSAETAIGADLGALMVPDKHLTAHDAGMKRLREHGEKRVVGKGRFKLEAKHANGTLFPVEFAVQSAETDEGEIFIAFLRDISHRVASEAALVSARDRALAGEKAKTDFLATMSHEIRTPLNGLLGNLTLLKDTKLTAQQNRYIKNMDTSGKLLMSHISDVLDITKYDAGKLQLRPVVMNLSTLLQDIIDNQSGAASANNTTLTWGWTGPNNDWIYADKERIQHILMNVIGNAVKFTQNGQVAVQLKLIGEVKAAPDLEIVVRDSGIGMDDTLRSQIFDDFLTGDASYDRPVGGTGLGLGIAQRFVTAMGGKIEVQSEIGKGSSFIIRFPMTPAPAVPTNRRKTDKSHNVTPCHILLVEDNEINRVVAREMLVAGGHKVTEVQNGKMAVELTQNQHFDLILMDISMPVMDGRTATRAIRGMAGPNAKTPIVALTANAMAEEQEAFLSDGMNNILTKPLSRDSLFDTLTRYVTGVLPSSHAQETAPQVVDPQHIQDLHDTLGATALQTLLDRFGKEIDDTIAFLGQAAEYPLEDIARTAHSIAGSAATLGATELRAVLIKIETAAKSGSTEDLHKTIADLPSVWSATRVLLKVV